MMKNKDKKASPIWLIIFLGAIIFLLNAIITSLKHRQQLISLEQELEKTVQQAEEWQKQKEEEIKSLEQKLEVETASPSVSLESTFPNKLESKTSTFSAEN